MTMVTTYNVNSFYIMLEEELVPPVVPKKGGGSFVSDEHLGQNQNKESIATDDKKPKSRVLFPGKRIMKSKKILIYLLKELIRN